MNLEALCSSTLQVQHANPNKLSPPYHFHTPLVQTYPYAKSISNAKTQIGFCNLRKRVSESIIVMRNHGDSVGIKCEAVVDKDDGFYMRRCVEIAKKAIGFTSPNPMVGCVIVKDGVVVGEGFHPKAGQPHAEAELKMFYSGHHMKNKDVVRRVATRKCRVFALRDAGDLAANATAYVSLEPCNHYGRTPPCTEALISAKVKRVVVGMVDPNPIVASKGVEKLRDSGIDVTVGVEEELCKKLNEAYIHRMLTGKPFVALRYSFSVNGQLSDQLGEGAKEAGGYYSQLLQEYDGIIYSSTSMTGKSIPTSKESHVKQPLQIIIARSPVQLPHFSTDAASQVIVFAQKDVTNPEIAQQGIETVILEKLQLNAILDHCAQRGLCSVLIDLQGSFVDLKELLEEGVDNGLLQKVVMELLPFWDEGKETLTLKNLEKRVIRLDKLHTKTSGESVVVCGYL